MIKVVICEACDGDGHLANQWAKVAMLKYGGTTKRLTDSCPGNFGSHGVYYLDAKGNSMCVKTIGGWCSECQGAGVHLVEVNNEWSSNNESPDPERYTAPGALLSLPYRSNCNCTCHEGKCLHMFPCCVPDSYKEKPNERKTETTEQNKKD